MTDNNNRSEIENKSNDIPFDLFNNNYEKDSSVDTNQKKSNKTVLGGNFMQLKNLLTNKPLILGTIITGFSFAVGYFYIDTAKNNKTVAIVEPANKIKEIPADPKGMEIEYLDKVVYGVVEGNSVDNNKVERLLPAPEKPVLMKVNDDGESVIKFSSDSDTQQGLTIKNNNQQLATSKTNKKKSTVKGTLKSGDVKDTKSVEQSKQDENIIDNNSVESEVGYKDNQPKETLNGADKAGVNYITPSEEITVKTDIKKEPKQVIKTVKKKAFDKNNLGWRVQLASVTSMDKVKSSYKAMKQKHSALKDTSLYVEEATVNGNKYYRIQAIGFNDAKQARNACKSIKSNGGDCIVKK